MRRKDRTEDGFRLRLETLTSEKKLAIPARTKYTTSDTTLSICHMALHLIEKGVSGVG